MEADFDAVVGLCEEAAKERPSEAALIASNALEIWKLPVLNAGRSAEARTRMADQRPADFGNFLARLRKVRGLRLDESQAMQCFAAFSASRRPLSRDDMLSALPSLAEASELLMRQFIQQMRRMLLQDRDATVKAKQAETDGIFGEPQKVADAKKARAAARGEADETSREYAALDAILAEWRRSHPGWRGPMWHSQVQFAWAFHELEFVEKASPGANTNVAGYADHLEQSMGLMARAAEHCPQSARAPDGDHESLELLRAWFGQMYQADAERATRRAGASGTSARIVAWLDRLPQDEGAAVRKALSQHLVRQLFTPDEGGAYARPKDIEVYHFVTGAVAVLGDIPEAAEFQRLVQGYRKLQGSIVFTVVPDGAIYRDGTWAGSSRRTFPVGRGAFGVWLTLQHTVEARRLSGGFRRYAQNQSENPGLALDARAAANYSNDMKRRLTAHLEGVFTVKHVEPLPRPEPLRQLAVAGDSPQEWQETPLFYVVLEPARSVPQARIPALPIELNFIDESGLVVLPFSAQPMDLDTGRRDPLVMRGAEVKERLLLNPRNIADGTVILQLDVTCPMLPPSPAELFPDLYPAGFEKDDDPAANEKITAANEKINVAFERGRPYARVTRQNEVKMRWRGASGEAEFRFPTGEVPADARLSRLVWWPGDLGETEGRAVPGATYRIEKLPRGPLSWRLPLWSVGGAAGVALLLWLIWLFAKMPMGKHQASPANAYELPESPTYLRSVHLLRRIAGDEAIHLSQDQRAEIEADIQRLEDAELSTRGDGAATPAPADLLRRWIEAANNARAQTES
jgi:hypothetical protein